jgi:hypothetical protein
MSAWPPYPSPVLHANKSNYRPAGAENYRPRRTFFCLAQVGRMETDSDSHCSGNREEVARLQMKYTYVQKG